MPEQTFRPATQSTQSVDEGLAKLEDELLRKSEAFNAQPKITELSAFLKTRFAQAEQHKKSEIQPRLEKCVRRKQGEYEPEVMSLIVAGGGNRTCANITGNKQSAGEAWLTETVAGSGDGKPWSFEPTPIPELSEKDRQAVLDDVLAQIGGDTPATVPQIVQQFLASTEIVEKQVEARAKEKTRNHEKLVEDQFAEGGFADALQGFIYDVTVYPTGFMKGPVIRTVETLKWKNGRTELERNIVPTWENPKPEDIYPDPTAGNIQQGYVFERVHYDPQDLYTMREVEGWNEAAIDGALHTFAPEADSPLVDHTRRDLEDRGTGATTTLVGLEYWGPIRVSLLMEWGMEIGSDREPGEWIQVCALTFGPHVVKVIENPDPLGRKPYSSASWNPLAGNIWGQSISEAMVDCQDNYAASVRNLMDNLAYNAGPMRQIDIDALPIGFDLAEVSPLETIQYSGKLSSTQKPPVEWFQPESNAGTLIGIMETFEAAGDNRTNIPRFVSGDKNASGAAETSSGLAQLRGDAQRGIKRVVGYIDKDIFATQLHRIYTWNLVHSEDDSIKADVTIVPRGALYELTKDLEAQRAAETLQATNNPIDNQILGIKGRAKQLRAVFAATKLPQDVVPDDEKLEELAAQIQAQQLQDQAEEVPA